MTTKTQRNWKQYNESLVARGDVTFWFDQEVIKSWTPKHSILKRGRPMLYSDLAIETILTVREVFHLTYRAVEGFSRSLFGMLGIENTSVPDYSSLCKRAKTLNVAIKVQNKQGPLNVCIDSTGLKVFGEGEWKVRKHGASKRRVWVKLHLAIDPNTGQVVAGVTTTNSIDDAAVTPNLLEQIDGDIVTVYGDTGYDKRKVYDATDKYGARLIVPPRKNARIDHIGTWGNNGNIRNQAIRQMREGRLDEWKRENGYGCRSLVETAMFRVKQSFGDRLKSRLPATQQTEVMIKLNALNRFAIK